MLQCSPRRSDRTDKFFEATAIPKITTRFNSLGDVGKKPLRNQLLLKLTSHRLVWERLPPRPNGPPAILREDLHLFRPETDLYDLHCHIRGRLSGMRRRPKLYGVHHRQSSGGVWRCWDLLWRSGNCGQYCAYASKTSVCWYSDEYVWCCIGSWAYTWRTDDRLSSTDVEVLLLGESAYVF